MIDARSYAFLCCLLQKRSGLVLSDSKEYLVESRLMPVAQRHGLKSLDELVSVARRADKDALCEEIVEAMTTNESSFYRDKTPFEHFEKVMLPYLLKNRLASRKIRIWCAAASTGQEPYSLAMVLKENAIKTVGWTVEIIATDLSSKVLEKARQGLYSQFEVQRGLPIQMLVKYFKRVDGMWQIDPEIRSMVRYMPLNLKDNFISMGTFDIIFCRNVLIYFSSADKSDVLNRLASLTAKDGYLILGATETILGLSDRFKSVDGYRGLYVPVAETSSMNRKQKIVR